MLFNSWSFAVFFPIVTALYFLSPQAWRWAVLIVASCYFYMFLIPKYILILFLLILVDYGAGIALEKTHGETKKWVLALSIVANVGILALFKYYNFFNSNLTDLAKFLGWNYQLPMLSMALPIGLSFHTFQSMSYTIEVYKGKQRAEKHLGIYALYVLFYPQLVAGPIERPQHLLPQLHAGHHWDSLRALAGLRLMAVGFFKKVVVADFLSGYVNEVYNNPRVYSGWPLIIATYCFAFQILCDFSGYTDIARGAAQVMGFNLMENFRLPYLAKSIPEFWHRWHISLSTWFRDYLYIPLGGNRTSRLRKYFNVFFVFLVSGLWHGANWTYIAWGALHGAAMVFVESTKTLREKWRNFASIKKSIYEAISLAATFHFVVFAWIFFRAKNIGDACFIATHLFAFTEKTQAPLVSSPIFFFILSAILGTILFYWFLCGVKWRASLAQKNRLWRWSINYLFAACLILVTFMSLSHRSENQEQQFIYFQF